MWPKLYCKLCRYIFCEKNIRSSDIDTLTRSSILHYFVCAKKNNKSWSISFVAGFFNILTKKNEVNKLIKKGDTHQNQISISTVTGAISVSLNWGLEIRGLFYRETQVSGSGTGMLIYDLSLFFKGESKSKLMMSSSVRSTCFLRICYFLGSGYFAPQISIIIIWYNLIM